jgi:hypothetical protein
MLCYQLFIRRWKLAYLKDRRALYGRYLSRLVKFVKINLIYTVFNSST